MPKVLLCDERYNFHHRPTHNCSHQLAARCVQRLWPSKREAKEGSYELIRDAPFADVLNFNQR